MCSASSSSWSFTKYIYIYFIFFIFFIYTHLCLYFLRYMLQYTDGSEVSPLKKGVNGLTDQRKLCPTMLITLYGTA